MKGSPKGEGLVMTLRGAPLMTGQGTMYHQDIERVQLLALSANYGL